MSCHSSEYRVHERIFKEGDRIIQVQFKYMETNPNGKGQTMSVTVARDAYEEMAASTHRRTLSFDNFVKVLRPFMNGTSALSDIPEAFRILDRDGSGTIDFRELATFVPIIAPHTTPNMLLKQIAKVDRNHDYRLNLAEFTDLIKKGIGRDIAFGFK